MSQTSIDLSIDLSIDPSSESDDIFGFRLPTDLKKVLKKVSLIEDRSMSDVAKRILTKHFIDEYKNPTNETKEAEYVKAVPDS